jgi:hypothetical protein
VEIEKTRKSDERLVYKLGKLTDRTQLDGVIYFCDTKQLVDVVCSTFTNKVLSKSSRIGHYPEHFMLFSRSENDEPVMPLEVYNSTGQKVFLEKWINYLKATQPLDRRDKNFETLGVSS